MWLKDYQSEFSNSGLATESFAEVIANVPHELNQWESFPPLDIPAMGDISSLDLTHTLPPLFDTPSSSLSVHEASGEDPQSSASVSIKYTSPNLCQLNSPTSDFPLGPPNPATGCHKCGRPFLNSTQLRRHIRRHTKPHKCPIDSCDAGFSDAKDLRRHNQTIHSTKALFFCPTDGCTFKEKGFKRKDGLTKHVRKVHALMS